MVDTPVPGSSAGRTVRSVLRLYTSLGALLDTNEEVGV
jgi:hypothetical protein|eukprot:COSAG01_NODE_3133_length_6533_cov_117.587842_8_plen_38_part_00